MRRYQISSQVYFQWQSRDGRVGAGAGFTIDMSAGSAYILAHPVPPLGVEIDVTVVVPSVAFSSASTSQMRGRGTVVRIVPDKGFVTKVSFHISKNGTLPRVGQTVT
jgi:hypothetical protein